MDTTAWVALAGIGGTLAAAVLSPFVTERMHRENARRDRLMVHQIEAYADLLRATARLADNAMAWALSPLQDLKETDNEELDRLISRVRVVASDDVHQQLTELTRHALEFNRLLYFAKLHRTRMDAAGEIDDPTSIQQRMSLGSAADKMIESHKQIEATVRKEMRG